jgi:hypothetical protein
MELNRVRAALRIVLIGSLLLGLDRTAAEVVRWIGPAAGDWSDAESWSTGAPPTPADDLVAGDTAPVAITHAVGDSEIRSLTLTGKLNISGGSITLTHASGIQGELWMAPGTSLTASGGSAVLVVTEGAEISGAHLLATGGARIELPGATHYAGAGLLRAEGAGSRLELSGVTGIGIPSPGIVDVGGAISRELSAFQAGAGSNGTLAAITGAVSRELSAYTGGSTGDIALDITGAASREISFYNGATGTEPGGALAIHAAISRELSAFNCNSGDETLGSAITGAVSRELSAYTGPSVSDVWPTGAISRELSIENQAEPSP